MTPFEYKVVYAFMQPLLLVHGPGLSGSSPGDIPSGRAKATQEGDQHPNLATIYAPQSCKSTLIPCVILILCFDLYMYWLTLPFRE